VSYEKSDDAEGELQVCQEFVGHHRGAEVGRRRHRRHRHIGLALVKRDPGPAKECGEKIGVFILKTATYAVLEKNGS
jgi:hypothetical protein